MESGIAVLIVDDNANLCRSLELILRRSGFQVTTAADGFEAIEKVRERDFDLVLLDIKLPRMDGVATYWEMREIRPRLAVIMMTAYAVDSEVDQVIRQGAVGVLEKPLDVNQVIALCRKSREKPAGASVLVVDDEPGTRTALKSVLEKLGHRVTGVETGEEAVAAAAAAPFDVVMVDMKLPGLNGLQTLLALRRASSETTVIMMTAYRDEVRELVREGLRSSARKCLYKPFDMQEVLELVEEAAQKKPQGEGAAAQGSS